MAVAKRPSPTRRIARRKPDAAATVARLAAALDRSADALLFLGLHRQAERLSRQAEAMRPEVAA